MLVRILAVGAVLGAAEAQCELPALPELTEWAPGNPVECVAGGELDGADQGPCTIQCVAGQAQGATGTYEYSCTGADLTSPVPECTPCPEDTYGPEAGLETCTGCPDNSVTGGATGATDVNQCLCNPGYFGELTIPTSECSPCPANTWSGDIGPGDCDACPANSESPPASTEISACLCSAGHSGTITAPGEECDACLEGQYKGTAGPEACSDCPDNSTTAAPASTEVTDCLCSPGHTGLVTVPDPEEPECTACVENTWKADAGPADCIDCPENSGTNGATGGIAPTACQCDDDFQGVIESENDQCRRPGTLGAGAIVGISAAAVVGVAAAFGGIMYGKGAYERGRRYSVQQDRNDPLMPGGSNA